MSAGESGGAAGPGGVAGAARDLVRGLAERAGLAELKEGLEAIEKVTRGQRGAEAEVWSAVSLIPAERTTLEDALRRRYGDGLPIRFHVEPAILGGVIVRVGDRYLDGSLATKLGQLRQQLLTGRS